MKLLWLAVSLMLAWLDLTLGLVVARRSDHSPSAPPGPSPIASRQQNIAPGEVGARVQEMNLTDIHGKRLSQGDLQGKVLLLDYWAPWCQPCEREMPGYQQLQQKYRDRGFLVIGVVFDPGMPMGKETPAHFAKRLGISYPLVKDSSDLQALLGGIQGIPTTFLIDRNRVIRYKVVGFEYTSAVEHALQPLLSAD
jgi:thiol-disulfide isomerase/thioredoxin